MKETRFYEIYERRLGRHTRIYTKALIPKNVYGENTYKEHGELFREWDAKRSKISAAIHKGLTQLGLAPGQVVLYLGASTGTTVSHVSDIVGKDGMVFALDFAPATTRQLVFLAKDRVNVAPILADANQPDTYKDFIPEQVDWIFQDVAQRNQVDIFVKNVMKYLKPGNLCAVAIKARSIDVAKPPKLIFQLVRKQLEEHLTITDFRTLDPFEMDHAFFTCKLK